ncbi:pyruvate kinase alpha/beta domain-containing protein [Cupriavidus basilensis]
MVNAATRAALAEGYAAPGDQITIAAGMPFGRGGTTNLLRVAEIGGTEPRQGACAWRRQRGAGGCGLIHHTHAPAPTPLLY